MIRLVATLLAVAVLAAPVTAQGFVGGYVVEHSGGRPVRCLCVSLLDSAGRVVDSTWTRTGGAFQFLVAETGTYRLRFGAGEIAHVTSDALHVTADSETARVFRIPLELDSATAARLEREANPDRLPRRSSSRDAPKYPERMRLLGIEGDVVLLFGLERNGTIDTMAVFALKATNQEFFQAVWKALPRQKYDSWEAASGQECFLAVQPFFFRLRQN